MKHHPTVSPHCQHSTNNYTTFTKLPYERDPPTNITPHTGSELVNHILIQPMADRLKLLGIPVFDRKNQVYLSNGKNPGWFGVYRALYYPVI